MRTRSIQLRWHGRCCVCLSELAAGELARFDPVVHEVTCSRCARGEVPAERPVPTTTMVRRGPRHTDIEREQVRAVIAEARAKLDAARHAS